MAALNEIQDRPGRAVDAISYEDLYARWERGNWQATGLDFTEDARQWREELTEFERTAALFNYALFFWGEDAVADNLSPYIDAAPREEQKYFLATQQVDEARHAVFFKRFMHEVAGIGNGDMASGLAAIKPQLTWGFRKVFDRLDLMADELRADHSRPQLARAITLYHLIIEASLAQPGQHMICRGLEQRDLLPAFRAGMENVAADEQRHIGFGVKLLADLCDEDPSCREAVADLLREVLPWTTAVLIPPGWDERYLTVWGFTFDEIGVEGVTSLSTKLRSAGLALEDLPGPPPLPLGLTPLEQAQRGMKLVKAGVFGEKLGPPSRDPEVQALLFDTLRRTVNPERTVGPITLQWEFDDAEPWHIEIPATGDARAASGRHPQPDLRLRSSFETWVDIVAGRIDPRRAVLRRRLRPRGRLPLLFKMEGLFGR